MLLSALIFVPVFLLCLAHLKVRRIPLHSWGTVVAVALLLAGLLWFLLIPVVALIVAVIVEAVVSMLSPQGRDELAAAAAAEEERSRQRITAARVEINQYRIVASYTIEHYARFNRDLAILDAAGLPHMTRSGVLTSIITDEASYERCCAALGIEPEPRPAAADDIDDLEAGTPEPREPPVAADLDPGPAVTRDPRNPFSPPGGG
jgi:hypothetical protein